MKHYSHSYNFFFSEMIVQDCQTIKLTLPIFYEKWEQNSIRKVSYWQLPFPPERKPLTRPMTSLSWARLWTLLTSWLTISMDGESHLFRLPRFFRVVRVNSIRLWNVKRLKDQFQRLPLNLLELRSLLAPFFLKCLESTITPTKVSFHHCVKKQTKIRN